MDFILILDLKIFYSSLFTTAKASNFAIDGERKQTKNSTRGISFNWRKGVIWSELMNRTYIVFDNLWTTLNMGGRNKKGKSIT